MEEEPKRETRQRSRSKTPLTLRSSMDRDVGTDADKKKTPIKKNPTVDTIVEESPAPSSQRTTRPKRNAAKIITSDYSSDASTDSARINKDTAALIANSVAVVPSALTASEQNISSVTKTTVITTKTVRSSGVEQTNIEPTVLSKLSSTTTSSNTKSTRASNRESDQNESNVLLEKNLKLKTSTPRVKYESAHTSFTDATSITNGNNLEDHVPFKEYKDAGEYWNKYPKTDYTYSKLSQQRREIKPGVIAMPNMSRRSLERHHERVNQMVERDPAQASFFRTRYESFTALRKRQTRAADSFYDSQDETDLTQFGRNGGSYYASSASTKSLIRRIIIAITTFFSSIYYRVTSVFRRKEVETIYYARLGQEKPGFFKRIGNGITGAFSTVFRYIYLCISSVLFLDSWLLQTSKESSGKKKGFLIGLLILLPLLLLGAWNLSDESDRIYYRNQLTHLNALPSISSLPDLHTTFDELTARTSKIIPIALTVFKSQTSNVSERLRFLFDFNWNWLPFLSNHVTHNHITNNIKASLSPDEYNNVLRHINTYIETVVAEKLQKYEETRERIAPEIALHIATIVKEHIIQHKYELNDGDIERIAAIVQIRLAKVNEENASSKTVPFILSQDNLEAITKIVKQNIEIHQHEWNIVHKTENVNIDESLPQLDINEILFKILTSSKLKDFVDQQISVKIDPLSAQLSNHQSSLDEIQNEIVFIKEKLSNAFYANQETRTSFANLKGHQDELSERLNSLQNQNNEQFEKLLNDIDLKLSSLNEKQFAAIDDHIRTVLVEIIGYKSTDGKTLKNIDISNWIRNVFVARELLETQLNELNAKFDDKLNVEINQSASILIKEISEKIKQDVLILIERNNAELIESGVGSGSSNITLDEQRIKTIIKEALAVYDADKTGIVDYALESSGGQVLSTRCTENFHVKSAQLSIFGIPLWYKTNTPRTVISPAVHPGECWAFQGFPGFLVLKLNHNILVTGFTMEHISKSLSPNGKIDSAPKLFTVWGLEAENDQEPYLFGEYEYTENGTSLQYFPVTNTEHNLRSHNIVELRIESNHGNINYTCLYRFRVHGSITPTFS